LIVDMFLKIEIAFYSRRHNQETFITPHLTRFYASLAPSLLMALIKEFLEGLGVKCKLSIKDATPASCDFGSADTIEGGYVQGG